MILSSKQFGKIQCFRLLPYPQNYSTAFNRYDEHESFGFHVDNSIRLIRGTSEQLRTDLSCTLFLSEPDEYEGGDLVIEDTYGYHEVKLPAGDVVLYPSTSLHEVSSITSGTRFASFSGYKVWSVTIVNATFYLILMRAFENYVNHTVITTQKS